MLFAILTLAMLPVLGVAEPSTQPATQPAEVRNGPIRYRRETRTNPPLEMHIVTVDLRDPAVRVVACPGGADPDEQGPWQTTLLPVRQIAERDQLDVAVNGNFFMTKEAVGLGALRTPYFAG